MTVCIVLERGDIIMSKSVEPCDPKEYSHLLYERRLYKNGRIEKGNDKSYYFYIKKGKPSEDQDETSRKYHVALLYTGELVCVSNGWAAQLYNPNSELYIGKGIFHHNEYYNEP